MYCVELLEQGQSFSGPRSLAQLTFAGEREALRFFERHRAFEAHPAGAAYLVRVCAAGHPIPANAPCFRTSRDGLDVIRDDYLRLQARRPR